MCRGPGQHKLFLLALWSEEPGIGAALWECLHISVLTVVISRVHQSSYYHRFSSLRSGQRESLKNHYHCSHPKIEDDTSERDNKQSILVPLLLLGLTLVNRGLLVENQENSFWSASKPSKHVHTTSKQETSCH